MRTSDGSGVLLKGRFTWLSEKGDMKNLAHSGYCCCAAKHKNSVPEKCCVANRGTLNGSSNGLEKHYLSERLTQPVSHNFCF